MLKARFAISLLALATLACAGAAAAQDDFYKGKTVEIIVGFGPGGSGGFTHEGESPRGNQAAPRAALALPTRSAKALASL